MSIPYHIQMLIDLPDDELTTEERKMVKDFKAKKGEYAPGGQWVPEQQNLLGFDKKSSKPKWNSKTYRRCYEDHPALPVPTENGLKYVYGGSCGDPVHDDADVYIGLDWKMYNHKERLPWEPGHAISYEITDGSIPKDVPEFKVLVNWLAEQILADKKVHIGCIGGHGRTGTVLAALVATLNPTEEKPITYVRTNYCKKAVESNAQINFLKEHYNCEQIEPSKPSYGYGGGTSKKHTVKVQPIASKLNVFGNSEITKK